MSVAVQQSTLSATSGSGTQGSTQSPQSSVGSAANFGGNNSSGGVQPGTASSLLTTGSGDTGVPLHNTPLTTVNVNNSAAAAAVAAAAGTTGTSTAKSTTPHHINAGLLSISGVLLVVAIGLFWGIARSAKNTTE